MMRVEEVVKMVGLVRWEMMFLSYFWVRNGSDWNFYLFEVYFCLFVGGMLLSIFLGLLFVNEDVEGFCY